MIRLTLKEIIDSCYLHAGEEEKYNAWTKCKDHSSFAYKEEQIRAMASIAIKNEPDKFLKKYKGKLFKPLSNHVRNTLETERFFENEFTYPATLRGSDPRSESPFSEVSTTIFKTAAEVNKDSILMLVDYKRTPEDRIDKIPLTFKFLNVSHCVYLRPAFSSIINNECSFHEKIIRINWFQFYSLEDCVS